MRGNTRGLSKNAAPSTPPILPPTPISPVTTGVSTACGGYTVCGGHNFCVSLCQHTLKSATPVTETLPSPCPVAAAHLLQQILLLLDLAV